MKKIIISLTLLLLMVSFQNCGEVYFSPVDNELVDKSASNLSKEVECGKYENSKNYPCTIHLEIQKNYQANKVDVLFVIDESISMQGIIDDVTQGLESLVDPSLYRGNIRFAVTNMHPAEVAEDGSVNYEVPFSNKWGGLSIGEYPGFMQLVSRNSIDEFNSYAQTAEKNVFESKQFVLQGCDPWFKPFAKNTNGESCLKAHTQIANSGVGVEAGVTSYHQLVKRHIETGTPLFREGALANVIFISDTHDHGREKKNKDNCDENGENCGLPIEANYYGTSRAPEYRVSYEELLADTQYLHNDQLLGLKMSAIAPLPGAWWDERFVDVNVVGSVGGRRIKGEWIQHDFSYLNYVRESGGVAMNPDQPEFYAEALEQILKSSQEMSKPMIQLAKECDGELELFVDGEEFESYELLGTTIVLDDSELNKDKVKIQINCNK